MISTGSLHSSSGTLLAGSSANSISEVTDIETEEEFNLEPPQVVLVISWFHEIFWRFILLNVFLWNHVHFFWNCQINFVINLGPSLSVTLLNFQNYSVILIWFYVKSISMKIAKNAQNKKPKLSNLANQSVEKNYGKRSCSTIFREINLLTFIETLIWRKKGDFSRKNCDRVL